MLRSDDLWHQLGDNHQLEEQVESHHIAEDDHEDDICDDDLDDLDEDITDEDAGKDAGFKEDWAKPVGNREQKVVICLKKIDLSKEQF